MEPPEWYRNYHAESWDEPDQQERTMMAGHLGYGPWPDELHQYHAHRRWEAAKHAYRQAHPALAEQEFQDLIEQVRRGP